MLVGQQHKRPVTSRVTGRFVVHVPEVYRTTLIRLVIW